MSDDYTITFQVPLSEGYSQQVVRRSRFDGRAVPVSTQASVRDNVEAARRRYPNATHVVHAFSLSNGHSEISGYSDDGEPKGTAGRPVLDVIRGLRITNVIVIIVRYFGGTKLGTGGLVRAYSVCARETLQTLTTESLREYLPFSITVPYDLFDSVRRILTQRGARNMNESFSTVVDMTGELPVEMYEVCSYDIAGISRGVIHL